MNPPDAPVTPEPDAPEIDPGAPVTEPEPAEPVEFSDRYDGARL